MSGWASFAVFLPSSLLRVDVRKNFRERTFVFGCRCWSCVFLMGFCLCFCFMFWRVAPESVWKNSLDVRSVFFWVRSLFLWFFRRRRFCFSRFRFRFSCFFLSREKDQVVTGHPHTHLCLLFLFFCPAAFGVSPVLAVRPASWRFFGVPFWAPRVFGILLEHTGLELARPFRGPFLDARRQGCFLASCPWFLFFPFCFVLRLHTFY